jgi:hypothetical protein
MAIKFRKTYEDENADRGGTAAPVWLGRGLVEEL